MKTNKKKPARSKISILTQICKFIPAHLVPKLARQMGVEIDRFGRASRDAIQGLESA